jgi:hypothetical protein
MIIFEPLRQIEWKEDDRLIGVYLPGQTYTCRDDAEHAALAAMLKRWLDDNVVRIIEQHPGTGPAVVGGRGEIT